MENCNLKMVRNNCAFDVIPAEVMTRGGIYIPETGRRANFKLARCVAVGPGLMNDRGEFLKPEVQVGDLVIFAPNAGLDVEYDGMKYLIADANESLAIVKEEKKLDA